ncbi:hypothetical protein TFLX_04902 [Thermoflexales bacterium]|nr:hypothetical protein TFLX_04902 [Thermoflexales bacterium]
MTHVKKPYSMLVLLTLITLLLAACGGAPPAPVVPSAEPGQTATLPADQPAQVPDSQPPATPATQPGQPSTLPGTELGGKAWQWVNTTYNDGRMFSPANPAAYTIAFSLVDGQVRITADCTTAQGDFMTANQELGFMLGGMPPATCAPDSLSAEFLKELSEATAYQTQGEMLTFTLSDGLMTLIAGQATAQPANPTGPAANLEGPTWKWTQTEYHNGSTVAAPDPEQYTLRFDQTAKRFIFTAACNNGSGSYTLDGQNLPLKVEGMTRAVCPPPSEDYIKQLDQAASYKVEGNTLSLILKRDAGTMRFTTSEPFTAGEPFTTSETQPAPEPSAPTTPVGSNLQRLTTGVWKWEQSADNGGQEWKPNNPANYTIQFNADGRLAIQVECNQVGGEHTADETNLTLLPGPVAQACPPPTLDDEFLRQLSEVSAYFFDGDSLILLWKMDSGSMKFTQ